MTRKRELEGAWEPSAGAGRRSFGPIAPPAGDGLSLRDSERFVVSAKLSEEEGARLCRQAIQEGMLRPADSHLADIEAARLVWIPLWRVDATAEGFHMGFRVLSDRRGRLRGVLPTGGVQHEDGVTVILARRMFPFDVSARIVLPLEALSPRSSPGMLGELGGEEIAPDLPREEALEEVRARMRRAILPTRAMYAQAEVRVKSVVMCWYPVWLRRYVYAGGAARKPEECHVALSASTGEVVSEKHPSVMGSLKTRITRLFKRF